MVFFLLPPEMFSRSRNDVSILKSFLLLPQANLPLLVVAWTIVPRNVFLLRVCYPAIAAGKTLYKITGRVEFF